VDTVKKRERERERERDMAVPEVGQPIGAAIIMKGLLAKNYQPILYRIPRPFHDSYSAMFHIVEVNSV
jgi:hypothetical protein